MIISSKLVLPLCNHCKIVLLNACIFDSIKFIKKIKKNRTGMHKRPEDGMWLPKGGQIGNGHIRISSLAHGERCKQASKQVMEEEFCIAKRPL